AGKPRSALSLPPVGAAPDNAGHLGQRFDIVDKRRLAMQAMSTGEWRFVARLAALVFQRFQEGCLFPKDVAAPRGKYLNVDAVCADETEPARFRQVLLELMLLSFVLVTDIKYALARADHQAGQQHAFDDQVRHLSEDFSVLEGAGLALVGVADDVFGCA